MPVYPSRPYSGNQNVGFVRHGRVNSMGDDSTASGRLAVGRMCSAEGLRRVFEPQRAEHIRPTLGRLRQSFSPSPARFLALPGANGIHIAVSPAVFSAGAPKNDGWNPWEFGQIPGNEPIFLVHGSWQDVHGD